MPEFETTAEVYERIDHLIRSNIRVAQVDYNVGIDCARLLELIKGAYLTANLGIAESIIRDLQTWRSVKRKKHVDRWKTRLDESIREMMDCLKTELDVRDVFLTANANIVRCSEVMQNVDAVPASTRRARVRVSTVNKISGFFWFNRAA